MSWPLVPAFSKRHLRAGTDALDPGERVFDQLKKNFCFFSGRRFKATKRRYSEVVIFDLDLHFAGFIDGSGEHTPHNATAKAVWCKGIDP